MPDPRPGESRDDFVDRCMGDPEAVNDFPDAEQRLAFCNAQFDRRERQDISGEDLEQDGGRLEPGGNQRRCPPGMKFDRETNSCVPEERTPEPETGATARSTCCETRFSATVEEMQEELDEIRRRQDETREFGLQALGNRRVPDHEDPFLEDELVLALTLSRAAFRRADDKVLPLYDEVLRDGATFNQVRFEDANEEASRLWRGLFEEVEEEAAATMAAAMDKGEARISRGILRGVPSRQVVLDGMVDISRFSTNEFFNSQVLPALQRQVDAFLTTGATEQLDLSAVRAVLDRRLKTVPYWRVVANAAASRSYHYGLVKAAQFQGFTGVRFVAVLDERTSKICETVNGSEWNIADAVNIVERAAAAGSVEEMKVVTPWLTDRDVRGLDPGALRDLGVLVPPLHGNCRSTLLPIF